MFGIELKPTYRPKTHTGFIKRKQYGIWLFLQCTRWTWHILSPTTKKTKQQHHKMNYKLYLYRIYYCLYINIYVCVLAMP